ncbi:MAG: GntR family transcriptional regulator [Puniceicoccales bacterium]
MREKVVGGEIAAGTALPSMQEIARLWDSNYFTVHRALTPLVKEGLLVRHKGVGTFVAETKRKLHTVGVYYGSDIISNPRHGYAIQLHRLLYQALNAKGLKLHTWLDPRELDEAKNHILPEVSAAVENQQIQALVAIMANSRMTKSLQKLPLPVVKFGGAPDGTNVYFPNREFLKRTLEYCARNSLRNIAFISSPSLLTTSERQRKRSQSESFSIVQNLCTKAGLNTQEAWFHIIDSGSLSRETERIKILRAYRSLLKSRRSHPDAVLVFPDNNLVTLHSALVEEQSALDPELKIISHSNVPLAFPMPHGPHYIGLCLKSVADGLVKQIVDASTGSPGTSIAADLIEPVINK